MSKSNKEIQQQISTLGSLLRANADRLTLTQGYRITARIEALRVELWVRGVEVELTD